MSKRKRLSPPAPDAGLETKAFVNGWQGVRPGVAPISDIAGASSAMAALTEVSDAMHAARSEGRMVLRIALSAIDIDYLKRDRLDMADEDMVALRTSIAARGQQTPLEVVETAPGRYGLIAGLRRLTALQALLAETGETARFGEALCLLRVPAEARDAYVAMVEENEIRQGLSFYERARIAAIAQDQGVYEDLGAALRGLYGAVSRAKRSKIKSFVALFRHLDDALQFPTAIPEHLGLALVARLEQEPGFGPDLQARLRAAAPADAAAERRALDQSLKQGKSLSNKAELVVKNPCDGVEMQVSPNRIILRGTRVDASLQQDLQAWLAARGV